jgi:hypothetical protein
MTIKKGNLHLERNTVVMQVETKCAPIHDNLKFSVTPNVGARDLEML